MGVFKIVKINNFRTRVGYSKAFEHKFLGPYRVTKILGDLNYQLEAENLATQIVHYNRMLHFNERKISPISLTCVSDQPFKSFRKL